MKYTTQCNTMAGSQIDDLLRMLLFPALWLFQKFQVPTRGIDYWCVVTLFYWCLVSHSRWVFLGSDTTYVSLRYSEIINSLTTGRFQWYFKQVIFKLILVIDDWDIPCEIALRGFSLDLIDDKSTLVQVMAWCCQATSHYLSQCWPRSMSQYGITRPQWVNISCHAACTTFSNQL